MGHKLTLSDLGLPADQQTATLCQGRVDPLTRQGAFIVKSDVQANDKGQVQSVDISYWYRLPSNDAPPKALSLIKAEADDQGVITKMTVAGRAVKLTNQDAVNAVKQAIRYVHDDLKQNKLPEVAKIVNDTDLHRTIGDNIKITGQKKGGGFDFKFLNFFNDKSGASQEELVLPSDPVMVKALFGMYTNTLTPSLMMKDGERPIAATHVATNNSYQNKFTLKSEDEGSFHLHASVNPDGHDDEPVYYSDLIEVFAKAANGSDATKLERIKIANVDLTNASNAEKMEAIGAINGMMHAASSHSAPVPLKHLAEYDLLKLTTSNNYLKKREQDGEDFRFMMVSEWGNSLTNVHAGFGNGLGACKRIMAGDVLGMHDFGFEPARDGSEFSGAIPNISDWRDEIDFITLTHRHLDHVGGLPYEDFSGKTIICTPQVFEHAKRNLRTAHGSKAGEMIKAINWDIINEPGSRTFSKDGGASGITVVFSPNATSHSTYCTPYYYCAFYTDDAGQKHIKGVYLNMGDLRDERSEPTDETGRFVKKQRIKEDFFKKGWREILQKAHPDLGLSDIPKGPTYADWDSTSVRSEGETPKMDEILDNMLDAAGWFDGRTILNTHLASSDNMFEILLHTAAYHRRDFTVFGKNMEDTQSIQNIFGYEELDRPWPKGHQNQIYMDTVHGRNLQKRVDELTEYAVTDKEIEEIMQAYEDYYKPYIHATTYSVQSDIAEDLGEYGSQERKELDLFARHKRLEQSNQKLEAEIKDLEKKAQKLKARSKTGKSPKAEEAQDQIERKTEKVVQNKDEMRRTALYFTRAYYDEYDQHDYAQWADAQLKQNMHNVLRDYSNNYWRYEKREEWADTFRVDYRDLGGIVITRNTNTSARMFEEHPENLYILITGSQGNEVEVEAQLNKILENRALLHGIDPEYRHTARPIDKHNTVLFNTQSVIPTNEKSRNMLINRAVKEHGFVTLNATHSGFELYNYHHMKPERLEWIEDTLQQKDPLYKKRELRHMLVSATMAIGYKGHGRGADIEPWMKRVQAEVNASQHVNNTEAARIIQNVATSLKQGTIDLVQDGEIVEIDRFAEEKAVVRGKVPRGIVLLRNEHPYQKPFKQIMHREGVKIIEAEGSATYLDPLLAGAPSEMTISTIFGLNADAELERDREPQKGKLQPSFKPAPVDVSGESEDEWGKRSPSVGAAVPGTDEWKRAKNLTLK